MGARDLRRGRRPWGQGACHTFLGLVAAATAIEPARASSHFRQAVDLLRRSRDATLLPVALLGQADVLARRDPVAALKLAGAASAIRARVGGEFPPIYRALAERVRAESEAALDGDAERLWAEGGRLGFDDAIALAFGTSAPRAVSPTG